jgi:hypothetical protein
MTDASSVTIKLRKAIRLAMEPLIALRMLMKFGLGLTIMEFCLQVFRVARRLRACER